MTTTNSTWTILNILNITAEYFAEHNFENPRLNAERLLSHVLQTDRVNLYLQFERILTPAEVHAYRDTVKRRSNHEPLQYITGDTEFMGLLFEVTRDVLIPRPETEVLVESALSLKNEWQNTSVRIWDIGTGSGCIAISLAHYWPDCQIYATDVSQAALNIAAKNAQLNKTKNIHFYRHDILADPLPFSHPVDIIVSNPPYISDSEYLSLDKEIIAYEPPSALTDQSDGLEFYRKILSLIEKPNECKFIFLEMSGTKTDEILSLVNSLGFDSEIIKDLNHIPRVLKILL